MFKGFVNNKKVFATIAIIMVGVIATNSPLVSLANKANDVENKAEAIEKITGIENINTDIRQDEKFIAIADGTISEIKIPNMGNNNIIVNDADRENGNYSMSLPEEVSEEKGVLSKNGTIIYTSDEKEVTVGVQPMMEKVNNVSFEGVRTTITIEDASASKEYSFKYNLQEGSKLVTAAEYLGEEFDTGEVYIVDENNEITTIIDKAWAKDANGNDIETYYKINANELVQVVNFDENTAFPVVADPSAWKVVKCVAAITWLVGSSVFAAAKIVKIKKYIKALGGIKATAELIVGGALTTAEAGTAIGNALLGLASEILGIDAIEDNCL